MLLNWISHSEKDFPGNIWRAPLVLGDTRHPRDLLTDLGVGFLAVLVAPAHRFNQSLVGIEQLVQLKLLHGREEATRHTDVDARADPHVLRLIGNHAVFPESSEDGLDVVVSLAALLPEIGRHGMHDDLKSTILQGRIVFHEEEHLVVEHL